LGKVLLVIENPDKRLEGGREEDSKEKRQLRGKLEELELKRFAGLNSLMWKVWREGNDNCRSSHAYKLEIDLEFDLK
jgi:hypothetical protein